jgi:hypothetical protein
MGYLTQWLRFRTFERKLVGKTQWSKRSLSILKFLPVTASDLGTQHTFPPIFPPPTSFPHTQGDQIGRFYDHLTVVFFGQFFEDCRSSLGQLVVTVQVIL